MKVVFKVQGTLSQLFIPYERVKLVVQPGQRDPMSYGINLSFENADF